MMSAQVSQNARPALLSFGFRPFFLLASLWSAASLTIWVVMLFTGSALPSRFDPLAWHIHEMLFGFVLGTIAGFLLTAVANWTGREPVKGALLALLVGFWLLGRAVCLFSALTPFWFAAACDLAFPVILACVVAHEIVAARNLRNLPIIGVIAVLGLADLLMHLEAAQAIDAGGSGWRLGLAAIVILISVIAGRIVPAFTRNWLTQRNKKGVPAPPGPLDRGALGVLHAGLALWALAPDFWLSGLLLILAAVLNGWRLWRWHGAATAAEPLLLILHIGYAWLVLGVALLGLAIIDPTVPLGAAIHALTVGAIGTMILAVMTRATRGHTGRPLAADRVTGALYVLASLAAVSRIAAALMPDWYLPLLAVSGAFWAAAFLGFAAAYGPMLLGPRRGT